MSSEIHVNGKAPQGLRRSHLHSIRQILCLASTASLESGFAIFQHSNQQSILAVYKRAKYLLTEAFRLTSESLDRLGCSQVQVNGEQVTALRITSEATHEPH
jgi:hypothetical protein